jgi:S-DNA-T family DNA segregation ATPase FtsK/SpoIIIE
MMERTGLARRPCPGMTPIIPGELRVMPERRNPRCDGAAWGLLLCGLIVAVCVFSHDPAAGTPNLLGPPGTWLARELATALGGAVHVLLAGWFVLVLMLLIRKSWLRWAGRLLGWLILLPCAAVGADWLGPEWVGGPLAGGGGVIGAWLHGLLAEVLPAPQAALAYAGASLVGIMLAADFAVRYVLWAIYYLCAALSWSSAFAAGRAETWRLRRVQRVTARDEMFDIPIIHKQHTPEETTDGEDEPADEPEHADRRAHESPRILPIVRTPEIALEDEYSFEGYELPPLSLLEEPEPFPFAEHDQKLRQRAALLEQTFQDFDLNVRVVGINAGPVVTQFEVALETGMRVNKVTNLADDLALHLRVPSVRVVAPIPGKNTVGIEVPNENRATVRLKEVILGVGRRLTRMKVPLFLGKDSEGRPLVYDLADIPHLLIAGTTGTGKSVCLNAIILSMLMTRRPDEIKLIMIDPKMTELTEYSKIPHLMHPVVKDVKKSEAILAWAVDKMEERYDILARARVRHVSAYNELGIDEIHRRLQPDEDEARRIPERMPYIVIVVDELSDLILQMKREVESHVIRLAQKSRAAGIHLVLATQKPTVDVITGLIKSNLPGRLCFKVASRSDSRVVLDEIGAEKLLGKGDMLFLQPGTSDLLRAQGTYASDQEISRVIGHLECDQPCYAAELVHLKPGGESGGTLEALRARDPVYEQAIEIVIREGRGSVSLLQRALGIGYGRAARLIDFMAEDGIVGVYNGSNAREVLFSPEDWETVKQGGKFAARA